MDVCFILSPSFQYVLKSLPVSCSSRQERKIDVAWRDQDLDAGQISSWAEPATSRGGANRENAACTSGLREMLDRRLTRSVSMSGGL